MTTAGDDATQEKNRLAELFDRASATYDRVGPRFFSYFGQQLVNQTALKVGATVLDVAAGRGAVLFPAAKKVGHDGEVIGVDYSEEMVRQTAAEIVSQGVKNARMMRMDAEKLDFDDASFDCVLCGFAIHFFPDVPLALREFKRVLKPGGIIAISNWGKGDDRWKWTEDLFRNPHAPQTKSRPSFAQPGTLEALLVECGFQDIRVTSHEADQPYASPEEWWITQWSHGMRGMWERMQPDVLEEKKAAAFAHLKAMQEPDGSIHQIWQGIFTFATKPQN